MGRVKKILASVMMGVMLVGGMMTPVVAPSGVVLAADGEEAGGTGAGGSSSGCVKTAILDGCSSVEDVLNLVVDIMTVGVGILAAIGLTASGIQYLTAGGNEERTRKSKRRIFEIVIGLAVYVGIYLIVKWLVPGM